MSSFLKLSIIAVTWTTLFVLYSINRFLTRGGFLKPSAKILLSSISIPGKAPGTLFSKAGVLLVFLANIASVFLLMVDVLSSATHPTLALVKVDLPLWTNIAGSILFVMNTLWGFFAMIYNPTYTPLYRLPPDQFILATQGPYSRIRHPRYASEAVLNIVLFLFTGIWFSLLGLIGWAAMYYQARAEENYLMALAAKEYGEYRQKTGMFFPKLRRKQQMEHSGMDLDEKQ